jgi:hypothetical protein
MCLIMKILCVRLLSAFFIYIFLHFLLSGAVCVVDLSDIDNTGNNQYGESYNIGNDTPQKNYRIAQYKDSRNRSDPLGKGDCVKEGGGE